MLFWAEMTLGFGPLEKITLSLGRGLLVPELAELIVEVTVTESSFYLLKNYLCSPPVPSKSMSAL